MDEIRLVLIDSQQSITGRIHRRFGNACVAALSAEPETIAELALALTRYHPNDTSPFDRFKTIDTIDCRACYSGRLIIDLALRVVTSESVYPPFGPIGLAGYLGRFKTPLPYRLSDDWLFLNSVNDYIAASYRRLQERCSKVQFDARKVLYGPPLLEWILRSVNKNDRTRQNARKLHSRWLTTARDDLNGQAPRDILLAKRECIDFDLHTRLLQWSLDDEPFPPPYIPIDSSGYRFAGFGSYEWVVYYDLVRYLLWCAMLYLNLPQAWQTDGPHPARVRSKDDDSQRIFSLDKRKAEWLEQPKLEYGGRIPALLLEVERIRLPVVMHNNDVVINNDCTTCKTIVRETRLQTNLDFWHIDTTHIDPDFAFSFFPRRDDWLESRFRTAPIETSDSEMEATN